MEVKGTQAHFSPIYIVDGGKDLKPVGHVAQHVTLCPDINPAKVNKVTILLDKLLPELRKVVTVLFRRVIDLDDPERPTILYQHLIVVHGQGHRLRLDLGDKARVHVIVFAFLWVTQHLPGLDDLVELVFALGTVGVLVGVVLEHQALVFLFKLTVSGPSVDLECFIVVLLALEGELAETVVDLALVLEQAEGDDK